jgi:endonuclease-3
MALVSHGKSLQTVLAELACHYPASISETAADPLALIIWENIGYLIDDERRQVLFAEFRVRVGLTADSIDRADDALLLDIANRGGMRPETRVERWRTIARITLDKCGGDLNAALRSRPLAKARSLLKAYPVIGDPGADKVLLFTGIAAQPCLESNGLRALARLGFFKEKSSYAASYRSAIEVLKAEGLASRDQLMAAYVLLRQHGRILCKRGAPICIECPLDRHCAHTAVKQL